MWLTLIRHAEPAYVSEGRSWINPPLTDRGHRQAGLLAERVGTWNVDELWVSPMVRARQTCEPVADRLITEPIEMPWLAEIQNPEDWDGSPAEEIEEFFATILTRSIEDMWDGSPGGESFRDFHIRITTGLSGALAERGITPVENHLWTEPDDRRIVVIAHAGTNAVILGKLLGVEPVPWEWDRFTHVHTGVSRVVSQRTAGYVSWSLRSLSDRSHLPPGLVTG